jgi:hypothetical protein
VNQCWSHDQQVCPDNRTITCNAPCP